MFTAADAILALLLAARIHGTDRAITATAKRCAQYLPRSQRYLMLHVMQCREPMKLAAFIAEDHDSWIKRQLEVVCR